jgi:hypothetical protein
VIRLRDVDDHLILDRDEHVLAQHSVDEGAAVEVHGWIGWRLAVGSWREQRRVVQVEVCSSQ